MRARDRTLPVITISQFQHHLSLIRAALPDELYSIHIKIAYHQNTGHPPPLSDLFAPFLSLARLKTFAISFRDKCIIRVADEDLHAFATAWPNLEVLSVQTWNWRPPVRLSTNRPPTVAGLVELAKTCPHLRRVTIPALDVSVLAVNGDMQSQKFEAKGHLGLRFLDVGVLVGDGGVAAHDVATILDRLFPYHDEYAPLTGGNHRRTQSWFDVQDVLRKLWAARY